MIELSDHRYQRLRLRILLVSLPESLWRPLSSFTTLCLGSPGPINHSQKALKPSANSLNTSTSMARTTRRIHILLDELPQYMPVPFHSSQPCTHDPWSEHYRPSNQAVTLECLSCLLLVNEILAGRCPDRISTLDVDLITAMNGAAATVYQPQAETHTILEL